MNRSFRNLSAFALVFAALTILSGTSAMAQTFRGTILGSVTDTSGASVPGATVTIKNLNTGLVRTVTTSEDGSFSAPELPIGNYSVVVEKSGFKQGVVTGIRVEVSSDRRADVTLQPGDVAQRIEVTGEALPMVESTSNTLGGIIESNVAANLPVNGRDYLKLVFLAPGVTGSPDQITDSPGSYGTFSVNGARGRSNNFLLDGTDMNDGYRNDPAINEAGVFGTPATILPVEAIAELRVASNFEAEYGRSAGGVINVVTKSGTNALHGSVFEYFRNNAFDARNYFNDKSEAQNPFHDNQFGGSLGGPIIKDRTFFFVDYEAVREQGAQSSAACVPTQDNINQAIADNGGVVNPVIANLLNPANGVNLWPQPTNGNDCYDNGGTNASLATPFSNRVDSAIVKIDHSFNVNNLLTGRYYIGDSDQSFPLALVGGGLIPGYNTFTPTRVQLISISYVATLTPSIVNESRVGWNRFAEGFFPEDRSFDPSTIELNTIPTGTPNAGAYNFGLPKISISSPNGSSFAPLGSDNGDPRQRVDTNWHYIDNVSWKSGKNDVKFGYEFRRTSISQIFNRGFRGTLDFNSLDDFIAGMPDGGGQRQGDTNRNTFENSHALYIQDSIRLTRNFTFNFGVRYDYFGIIGEKHGNFSNFDPLTGVPFVVGNSRLYQPDYNNYSPRVSAAWDAFGTQKTVIRAGFGVFYDAFSQDLFMGHLPFNSSFDPGVAYNGYVGNNRIGSASLVGGTLDPNAQVYGFALPMPDFFGVDKNIVTPYMENYNLNLQQQLTRKMVLQIGYVGSQGHKLLRFRDLNQPTIAAIQAYNYHNSVDNTGGCCVPGVYTGGGTYYNYQESSANSNYNSLQVSYRIEDWHGLTSSLNYTWSHSIDDASDGEDFVPNASQPDNSQAPIRMNRGNSNFDVHNRLTWNFIFQIPDSRDSSMKLLRNGWGFNGIVTVQSGQPFQLNYNFEDDYNGSGEFFGRPDIVGPAIYNQHDPNNFLQLSSFAIPCTLDGLGTAATNCLSINPLNPAQNCDVNFTGCKNTMHFGSLGRNSLIGPNFRQFDFSVFKKTQLGERLVMELRFEAYNLLNHPNFANPYLPSFIADAAANSFNSNGTSAGALHLTATGDVGIGYPFLGSGGPRSLQLAAKFNF